MPWHKPDDETITFECESCDVVVDCDIKTVRSRSVSPGEPCSDFIVCYRLMQLSGWRSFKRLGREWTYHCPACGPQAERDHVEHQKHENERDRIKSRNARD